MRSTQSTNAAISECHGSAAASDSSLASPSSGYSRSPPSDVAAPMLPPCSAGAAENEYAATPRSHATRMLLVNGNEAGIARLPSTIAEAPSYSTSACTCLTRSPRASTVRGSPSSQFAWSKSWIIRSTGTPPDCAASAIQSLQSGGCESRCALNVSGRPSSPAEIRRASSTYSGQKRSTSPTMRIRPLRSAAARIASASSSVSAIGFSSRTCLPAANARSAAARWSAVGRQTSTASTAEPAIASARSVVACASNGSATRAAVFAVCE